MIRLTLFGQLELMGEDGRPIDDILHRRKALAVLIYLALAGPGGFRSRDTVLGLFWPESRQASARHALVEVLRTLRGAVGEGVIVNRGRTEVGIRAGAILCDAIECDLALRRGSDSEAVELYRGELLPGFFVFKAAEFEHWLAQERDRYRRLVSSAAWRLCDSAEKAGAPRAAIAWAERASGISLHDEISVQKHIQLLDRVGDRVGALQAYDSFKRRLMQELDMAPSVETTALVAQIRSRVELPARDRRPEATTTQLAAGEVQPDAGTTVGESLLPVAHAVRSNSAGIRRWLRTRWVAPAVIVMMLACVAAWGQRDRLSALIDPAGNGRTSVSVAEIAGTDPVSTRLGHALTAGVVDKLAQIRTFDVTGPELMDIARARLRSAGSRGPQLLLTGSVERSVRETRVTVQVADIQSGRTIKSESLTEPNGGKGGDIDRLAGEISSFIRTTIGHEVKLRKWRATLASDSAYHMLLQIAQDRELAGQLWGSGDLVATARVLDAADSTARAAEQIAGNASMLMLERAEVLELIAVLHTDPRLLDSAVVQKALSDGMAEAEWAVSLAPRDAEALEFVGRMSQWYRSEVPVSRDSARRISARAEAALQHAVAIDPQRAEAWSALSGLQFERADYTGAYLAANRAYAADQYARNPSEILNMLSSAAFEIGDDSAAIGWCAELAKKSPGDWPSSYCELSAMASSGGAQLPSDDIARAWAIASDTTASTGGDRRIDPMLDMLIASILARHGLRDSATVVMQRAAKAGLGNAEILPLEAQVYVFLHQYDTATALLNRYYVEDPLDRAGVVRSRRYIVVPGLQEELTREGVPLADR